MRPEPTAPRVEFVILADRAEVLNGKLYLMGGCWDRIQLPTLPAVHPMAVAARVALGAPAPGSEHEVTLRLEDPEGHQERLGVFRFQPNAVQAGGPDANFALMSGTVMASLPTAGLYALHAAVDGAGEATAYFTVSLGPDSAS